MPAEITLPFPPLPPGGPGASSRGKVPASNAGRTEQEWRQKPVINVIYGRPEGGNTAGEQKQWARQLYVGAVAHVEPPVKRSKHEPIYFTDEDFPDGPTPHRDALVIAMDVGGTVVQRVLVDTGSSFNVLSWDTFQKLGLKRADLGRIKTPLADFTGDSIQPEGKIRLPTEIGEYHNLRKIDLDFLVVDVDCVQNIILGRPALEDLGAIISMEHLAMKFHTPSGIGIARSN